MQLRRCEASSARPHANDRWGDTPSAAAAAAIAFMTDGIDADHVHCLRDESVVLALSGGRRVRVVGTPWTTMPGLGARSACAHCCRMPPEAEADAGPLWAEHWNHIGALMLSTPALPCVLVTHAPPKGVLDRASKHTGRACEGGGYDQRVGDPSLLEIVRRASAKVPVLHLFGHVHARQWLFPSPEPEQGPRLGVSCRVGGEFGALFCNCAMERTLPAITGFRLCKQASKRDRPQEHDEHLMRAPSLLHLPLRGSHDWLAPERRQRLGVDKNARRPQMTRRLALRALEELV